jgi:hypothetical protein
MCSRRIFTPMPMRVSPPKISILPDVAGSLSPMAAPKKESVNVTAPITIIGVESQFPFRVNL